MHAVAADRFRRFLNRPERLLVTLQIGGESADDALEVPRTGDDPGGHDALRRSQVDEVEDELLARMGDAEQIGIAAFQLLVADLDVEARFGLVHEISLVMSASM